MFSHVTIGSNDVEKAKRFYDATLAPLGLTAHAAYPDEAVGYGAAGDDAFTVGSTVTVPLRGGSSRHVIDAVADFGAVVTATSTRPPTLDDVYLRLTGTRLAA